MDKTASCLMIIFGGTGDLTHRKLLPALHRMKQQNWLNESFAVISVGRREKSSAEYRQEVFDALGKYASFAVDSDAWTDFSQRLHYQRVDFSNPGDYGELDALAESLGQSFQTGGNILFYLAVAPDLFEVILNNLSGSRLIKAHDSGWKRLIVEKPYGSSLESAKRLNLQILELFGEENAYRIDHYLGKEMVQSLMGIRFSNTLFEPLWNTRYIDNVQITIGETLGIENRGEYYDKAGALGDMIQNHMLQILSLIAMEPPIRYDHETIRDEKVKVLKAIRPIKAEDFHRSLVFGQYGNGKQGDARLSAYREEPRVSPESQTETYAAIKFQLDMKRWRGVPFYVRTGKRMKTKVTMVVIEFRQKAPMAAQDGFGQGPNLLVIKIQPKEEVLIQFNTKTPGLIHKICPVRMSYCQNCEVCKARHSAPESYEKLLFDVLQGDSTLFTRYDEVERSWEIVEALRALKNKASCALTNYAPGSWGPDAADALLEREGRHWWNLEEEGSSCGSGISP